ncbi:MAG TPA: OmpW family outer membrane protein [Thermoanaerobaculia bacterium]|nr:OmpW family outer membrane protein [Thermoanaerobaculia bacterium]
MKTVIAIVVSLLALPLAAQSNSISVWGTYQLNQGTDTIEPGLTSEVKDGSGFGAAYARMFTNNISGELAVFRTSSSASLNAAGLGTADLGDAELTPITAMVRYHFGGHFYVGGGLAQVMTSDLHIEGETVAVDDKTEPVFGAGATWDFTPRLGLALDARWMPLKLTGETPDGSRASVNLDPLLLSAGVRVRW